MKTTFAVYKKQKIVTRQLVLLRSLKLGSFYAEDVISIARYNIK